MTEQEKIEQAACEYSSQYMVHPGDMVVDAIKHAYKAGASYYEKECMPGQLAKAMEWISLKGLYQEIDGRWYDKFGGKVSMVAETTKELLTLFEKYKLNQDAAI